MEKWTSIDSALPEDAYHVLVWIDDPHVQGAGSRGIGYYETRWYVIGRDGPAEPAVSYWRQLPEGPHRDIIQAAHTNAVQANVATERVIAERDTLITQNARLVEALRGQCVFDNNGDEDNPPQGECILCCCVWLVGESEVHTPECLAKVTA